MYSTAELKRAFNIRDLLENSLCRTCPTQNSRMNTFNQAFAPQPTQHPISTQFSMTSMANSSIQYETTTLSPQNSMTQLHSNTSGPAFNYLLHLATTLPLPLNRSSNTNPTWFLWVLCTTNTLKFRLFQEPLRPTCPLLRCFFFQPLHLFKLLHLFISPTPTHNNHSTFLTQLESSMVSIFLY